MISRLRCICAGQNEHRNLVLAGGRDPPLVPPESRRAAICRGGYGGVKKVQSASPPKLASAAFTFLRRPAALFAAMTAQEQKGHLAR